MMAKRTMRTVVADLVEHHEKGSGKLYMEQMACYLNELGEILRASEYNDTKAIHVVITDRDDNTPNVETYPIIHETRATGATKEKAEERILALHGRYGRAWIGRVEIVEGPL